MLAFAEPKKWVYLFWFKGAGIAQFVPEVLFRRNQRRNRILVASLVRSPHSLPVHLRRRSKGLDLRLCSILSQNSSQRREKKEPKSLGQFRVGSRSGLTRLAQKPNSSSLQHTNVSKHYNQGIIWLIDSQNWFVIFGAIRTQNWAPFFFFLLDSFRRGLRSEQSGLIVW